MSANMNTMIHFKRNHCMELPFSPSDITWKNVCTSSFLKKHTDISLYCAISFTFGDVGVGLKDLDNF